ncbi:hypothetical protein KVR01_000041 [Diaporthe batatas]|uniref:uncharacterized protein n=1 Tax=Diaporthe batatas TaxID=748121 RepID=UPI001D0362E2|nr:uncharacterized protein KVR01_000041 [Diaporthe batatas]KAG8169296.1 hypothetical protein KVR01_000041 [Diaporthe batatas]
MKRFKQAVSKIRSRDSEESTTAIQKSGATPSEDDTSPALWTTGQEFQFYVPWLWKDSPEPPREKRGLHPDRQIVRITRLTNLPGFTDEFHDAWIQQCVANAVKYLVFDKEHYPTCTESELDQRRKDKTEAWKQFNIVQRQCNLPKIALPGYDGVLAVEMTIVIKEAFVSQDPASASTLLAWRALPTPGKCIERIKNQIQIHLTPECSMHVHIRPEKMQAFDLLSFKQMASILWLAEERLDKLYHPAHSASNSAFHHRSLRYHSNLALNHSPILASRDDDHAAVLEFLDSEATEKKNLGTIWQAINRHQLRELLRVHPSIGKHDFAAYNFFNLFMASEKQTIEFRKTESTTDGEVIDAWIEAFIILAHFCMTSPMEKFQTVLESLAKPQIAYNTWNLLEDIGCRKTIVDVLKQKAWRQWLAQGPAACPTRTGVDSPGSTRQNFASRAHFLAAIRRGTEKFWGMVATGYSYGR